MVDELQRSINELTSNMVEAISNHTSSDDDDDEYCSSSSGSFNGIHEQYDNNGKRTKRKNREVYALSCGMILPKRRRRRYSVVNDPLETLYSSHFGCNTVSHEPSSSSTSSYDSATLNDFDQVRQHNDTQRRRHKSHRRTPTPFPAFLTQSEPFQKYVTKIYSNEYDTSGKSKTLNPMDLAVQSKPQRVLSHCIAVDQQPYPKTATIISSVPTMSASTTLLAQKQFNSSLQCDILLSNQMLSMTDALEFSAKPHCLIEATAPHHVLHSNAALFASLLQTKHTSSNDTTSVTSTASNGANTMTQSFSTSTSSTVPIPSTITSTAPSSLASSWDAVQSQINLLFGLCFASRPNTSTKSSTCSERRGIVTLYPVYSTKHDFDRFMTGIDTSNGNIETFLPRYYLIEVSNSDDDTLNMSSSSFYHPSATDHHKSSIDGLPKLVIA